MYVAKEDELKTLKVKYQKMEEAYSNMAHKIISTKKNIDLSEHNPSQTAFNQSLLLQNDSNKTNQVGVSEETYYEKLKELCYATARLDTLQKTVVKKIRFESWTQTDDTRSSDNDDKKLRENYQALQERMEKDQLKMELLIKENENLNKQLQQERQAKRIVEEDVKKFEAKLKREKELHENTKEKLKPKGLARVQLQKSGLSQRCHQQQWFCVPAQNELVADCMGESIPTLKKCDNCLQSFPSGEEFENHKKSCDI